MDSAGASSSAFDTFKSKKLLRSSVNKPHLSGEDISRAVKTPEKPTNPPRRPLTRRHALRSVNQIREAAKELRISDPKPPISSDPVASSTETLASKPNASKPLPEKYEMLHTFFDRLTSSIRLLGLKRSMPSFANISRMIESLTDRSFGYGHLAQLKFILPEAIEIKKILVRDDRTSCMKPDLLISLDLSIVVAKDDDEKLRFDDAYSLLRKLFRSRLLSFWRSNFEGDDVPEEKLPEPFNKSSTSLNLNPIPIQKDDMEPVQDVTSSISDMQPAAASIMPQSFKRRFSKQVSPQNLEPVSQQSRALTTETPVDHELATVCVKASAKLPETPIKGFDGTPVKFVSTPFSATPAQLVQPSVRCYMTPNDEDSVMPPSKLTKRSKRLKFDTPVKNITPPVERVSTYDNDDVLSDDLLATIRANELKALEEKKPEITQAKWRKQMISGLPKLFDALLFYFQSVKRTVVTKEELMNIITSSQLEIVDRREADEQLRLLQEFAPEWIYEKMASSGDLLICVNKISSPGSIRTRLSNAN